MTRRSTTEIEDMLLDAQRRYDAGEAHLSDAEFDELVEELRVRSPNNRVLRHLGAPATSAKVRHLEPALSLNKIKREQLHRWLEQRGGLTGSFIVEPKFDGVSLILQYEGGHLVSAATRGDGLEGDDVLENALLVPDIPTEIRLLRRTQVRGELIMPLSVFHELVDAPANPRNTVAGLLMRKGGDRSLLQRCRFIAHDTTFQSANSRMHRYRWLSSCGFFVAHAQACDGVAAPARIDAMLQQQPLELADFELDGYVVKLDCLSDAKKLGATAHHPNSACAIKLADTAKNTVLRDVLWQVSRTGVIAPVGIVDPVKLAGATVTRVTLHNLDVIAGLGVHIGDLVSMTRRGAVIPQVEAVVAPGMPRGRITPPQDCPSCGARTVRPAGAFLRCSMPHTCRDVHVHQLIHWTESVGVLGFGFATMAQLYDERVIRTPVDFYRVLDEQDRELAFRESLGGKIAAKLAQQLEKTRTLEPSVFVQALGIDGLGRSASRTMIEALGSLDALMAWARMSERDRPLFMANIGYKTAITYANGLVDAEDLIDALLEYVQLRSHDVPSVTTGPFAGKNVVFTGPLASMSREEAQAAVRKLGAQTPSGLTRSTDILVVGGEARDEQSGKRDKAARYNAKGSNIEVIDEDAFILCLATAEKA